MFGLGPTEIILIAMVLALFVVLAIGVIIIYLIFKHLSGNRAHKLEARIDDLEKRLDEQQKK